MELLLNLIWLVLAVGTVAAFVRDRLARGEKVPWRQPLVALACIVVLLFPVISASDDLHPTQAVVEDASKKVQLAIAPLHLQRAVATPSMLPTLSALCMMLTAAALSPFPPMPVNASVLDGVPLRLTGRAPPNSWN